MIFKSQLLAQASGSVGGLTFSHNAGGMYVRNRATPVNPNTSYQQAVRSILSSLATRWQDTLTAAQRAAWAVYGGNVPATNRLGEQIFLTGLQQFIRCNTPRYQAVAEVVDDGPTTYVLPTFTPPVPTISAASQQVSWVFDNTDDWANEDSGYMLVYVSRPVAPTINYFKGPYRYTTIVAGNSVTPPTSPQAIAVPFAVAEGQKVFVRAAVVRADGRLSPDFRGGVVVAA